MAEVLNRMNKHRQHSSSRTGERKIRGMELNVWQILGQGRVGKGKEKFEIQ